MELKKIIKGIKSICDDEGLRPDDNTILDSATRIYNTQYIQDKKSQSNSSWEKEELATEKQIATLKKLKKPVKQGLTKKEAFTIIKEAYK